MPFCSRNPQVTFEKKLTLKIIIFSKFNSYFITAWESGIASFALGLGAT